MNIFASQKISQLPHIKAFLDGEFNTAVGWGRKKSGIKALALANSNSKPALLLEDGFLRSVDREGHALSLVLDQTGIYYDANTCSDLELFVKKTISDKEYQRSSALIKTWKDNSLSKYNANPDYPVKDIELSKEYVLVCDQTHGDASIKYGLASEESFIEMLDSALEENPQCAVVVKTHPDISTRAKKGHFDIDRLNQNPRIKVVTSPCHPVNLIKNAKTVYTVTSQMGFEALIWGKPVRTFGMPFYAGWGLTQDELPAPDRRKAATLEQLVHAALIDYARYVDPITGTPCDLERIAEHIGLQRKLRMQLPEKLFAVGFSRWKRPFIQKFLAGSSIEFLPKPMKWSKTRLAKALESDTQDPSKTFLLWGNQHLATLPKNSKTIHIEDGFLRSVGLGADLVKPLSLAIDDVGIYYDATKPSRLEKILETQVLTDEQITRATLLRERIVKMNITKYNNQTTSAISVDTPKKKILVVGQVESDASIKKGSPDIKSNFELLKAVRKSNPESYILYKPHPDVVAGLRDRSDHADQLQYLCDQIIIDSDANTLFSQIDELHTMTSLMGFEALLRGVKVCCHGIPFYSGWGLTIDTVSCGRRTKSLSLDELVYGALIAYPRYLNYEKNVFVEVEEALDSLAHQSNNHKSSQSWRLKLFRALLKPEFLLRKKVKL